MPTRDALREMVQKDKKVKDIKQILVYDCQTKHGGNISTATCIIYNNIEALMKIEAKYRVIRAGFIEKPKAVSRKMLKTHKNKLIRKFGTAKAKVVMSGKK